MYFVEPRDNALDDFGNSSLIHLSHNDLLLLVGLLAAELDLINDGHDGGINRSVVGDFGLTGRTASRVEHDLANAGADRICRHNGLTCDDARAIASSHQKESESFKSGFFTAGDDGTDYLA